MITIQLTEDEVAEIVEELININEAERYYLNGEFVNEEEREEIGAKLVSRSDLIFKFTEAGLKANRRHG
jgi:cystathionine beta-lyase family protein involved in aluminum resistance